MLYQYKIIIMLVYSFRYYRNLNLIYLLAVVFDFARAFPLMVDIKIVAVISKTIRFEPG